MAWLLSARVRLTPRIVRSVSERPGLKWPATPKVTKLSGTLLDLCVSSLRSGHANLLCIVPILMGVILHPMLDDPRSSSIESDTPRPPSPTEGGASPPATRGQLKASTCYYKQLPPVAVYRNKPPPPPAAETTSEDPPTNPQPHHQPGTINHTPPQTTSLPSLSAAMPFSLAPRARPKCRIPGGPGFHQNKIALLENCALAYASKRHILTPGLRRYKRQPA